MTIFDESQTSRTQKNSRTKYKIKGHFKDIKDVYTPCENICHSDCFFFQITTAIKKNRRFEKKILIIINCVVHQIILHKYSLQMNVFCPKANVIELDVEILQRSGMLPSQRLEPLSDEQAHLRVH